MDVEFRPGTLADNPRIHELFRNTVEDLAVRLGVMEAGPVDVAARHERWEQLYEPLMRHLTETAEAFWVVDDAEGLLGYARTINRSGLRELTEFFVRPGAQGSGVGRELLGRAFPTSGADVLSIIATIDHRAQNRYVTAGVFPHLPIVAIGGTPSERPIDPSLHAEPMDPSGSTAARCGEIDAVVLGHVRPEDHRWLAAHRPGWLYFRGRALVGYGYVGPTPGPIATLDLGDLPPILDHLETQSFATGETELYWDVPGSNATALTHLRNRGHRIDPWVTLLMSDQPFGQLDRYVVSGPTFFL